MVRRISAALAVLALSLGVAACGGAGAGGGTAGSHAGDGAPRVSFETAESKEQLGEDDGFDAVIFYGAELGGSIDDCGCPGHPQGGLPWRLGYTEGFRHKYSDVGFLQVDAGNSMSNTINSDGKLFPDAAVKNEWVIKAFDRLNFDAANISHGDMYYLSQFFQSGLHQQAVSDHPILARFVSANIEPTRPELVAPAPYVVRELGGGRISGGPVRVAFVGLTENNPVLRTHTGYRTTEPGEALAEVLPRARAESDMVVVLAYMAPDGAKALATKFQDQVAAFVVAHPNARVAMPTLDAPPRVTYARFQTRQLGELRLHLNGKQIESVANRYITLDEKLPKDPIAEQMAADAKSAVKKAQMDRFNASGPTAAPPVAGAPAQPAPAPAPAPGGEK
jgi:hypothetical protein